MQNILSVTCNFSIQDMVGQGTPLRENGYSDSLTYYCEVLVLACDCCVVIACNTKTLLAIDNTEEYYH